MMSKKKVEEPLPNRTRLLNAAALEFATRGLQGARLEVIASESDITRAMIYYYFGGREGLYLAALEECYRHIRASEAAVDLTGLDPIAALRKLTDFRIDYYVENPLFVALVAIENQQRAAYLRTSEQISRRSVSSLESLDHVLKAGQQAGLFRDDIDLIEVHQVMVSIGMFNVSNQHTFGAVFSRDMSAPARLTRTRQLAFDVVMGLLRRLPEAATTEDKKGSKRASPARATSSKAASARGRSTANRA